MERSPRKRVAERVVHVLPVVSLSRTDIRPRPRNEIEIMLESGDYSPVLIVTEPIQVSGLRRTFAAKTFEDPRVEAYWVPNLAIGPLTLNRRFGVFGKIMFGLFNALSQLIYLAYLSMLLFCIVTIKRAVIIHAHNPPDLTGVAGFLVSRVTKVPYIFEAHDRTPELESYEMGYSATSFVYKLLKVIERVVVTHCVALITVNKTTSNYFKTYGVRKTVPIYSGMRTSGHGSLRSTESHTRRKLLPGDKRVILYEGTLNMAEFGMPVSYDLTLPLKALPAILHEVPEAMLVYVGDGTGKNYLRNLAKLMGLRDTVLLTGFVSREEVFEWIRRADVVIVPYANVPHSRLTTPTKLLEYVSVGKPIVAAKREGISEIIIDGQNGLLYTTGSIEEFSQCVLRILKDRLFADKLASNVKREFRSKFSFENNWPKLISLYDSISGFDRSSEHVGPTVRAVDG